MSNFFYIFARSLAALAFLASAILQIVNWSISKGEITAFLTSHFEMHQHLALPILLISLLFQLSGSLALLFGHFVRLACVFLFFYLCFDTALLFTYDTRAILQNLALMAIPMLFFAAPSSEDVL